MSEVSPEQAMDQVLHPELQPPNSFTIGGHTIALRPLPIKHAKILKAKVAPFETFFQQENLSAFAAFSEVAELFIDAAAHLLSFYGIEGASKEWMEETLEFDDVRVFIAKQLEMQKRDDFLLIPLRMLSEQMAAAAKRATNIVATVPEEQIALSQENQST